MKESKKIKKTQGSILIELILVVIILLFVAGAVWYAGNKPSKNQQSTVETTEATPAGKSDETSQMTSAEDVDKNIKELDQESTSQLDADLDDVDASLKNL